MAHRTDHCRANHGDTPTRDRSGHCSACRRERKQRERAERRALVRQLKQERGCARCGGRDDLHFHHRDPASKTQKVAYMVRWGTERLLAEIAKCDVLCSACHTVHHHPHLTQPSAEG